MQTQQENFTVHAHVGVVSVQSGNHWLGWCLVRKQVKSIQVSSTVQAKRHPMSYLLALGLLGKVSW